MTDDQLDDAFLAERGLAVTQKSEKVWTAHILADALNIGSTGETRLEAIVNLAAGLKSAFELCHNDLASERQGDGKKDQWRRQYEGAERQLAEAISSLSAYRSACRHESAERIAEIFLERDFAVDELITIESILSGKLTIDAAAEIESGSTPAKALYLRKRYKKTEKQLEDAQCEVASLETKLMESLKENGRLKAENTKLVTENEELKGRIGNALI